MDESTTAPSGSRRVVARETRRRSQLKPTPPPPETQLVKIVDPAKWILDPRRHSFLNLWDMYMVAALLFT